MENSKGKSALFSDSRKINRNKYKLFMNFTILLLPKQPMIDIMRQNGSDVNVIL